MRLLVLFREAFVTVRASPVPSALVVVVAAAMCLAAIVTAGRQAALEASVAEQLAGPAARSVTLTDGNNTGTLTPQALALLGSISTAEAVLGIGAPVDVFNGALGPAATRVALIGGSGDVGSAVRVVAGRMPAAATEAVVSVEVQERLGLAEPSGSVESLAGQQWAIVGLFEPIAPFEDLGSVAFTVDDNPIAPLRQVKVVADDATTARATQNAALAILAAGPAGLSVQSATAGSDLTHQLTGQVTGYGRSLVLMILAVGGFLVAIVVLADVLVRRRDLGRRRALGITRADLVVLVLVRTSISSAIGAVIGAAAGTVATRAAGTTAPLEFAAAVAVLATISGAIAALPPAAFSATRDPVAVLRTA